MLTMGSLFDGIGGFPLAAVHNGITPVWASEIEPFGMEVTKTRFPGMRHVGDIMKLDGGKLLPVDVICGGSPCQDLSVAGRRCGLAGERSGLFREQVRVVKEMRDTDGNRRVSDYLIRPRYLIWENVPGAFSSAGGEDFRAVIEGIVRIKADSCHVPQPDTGRWEPAGIAILGNGFSLAWRVLDAQYWGVPQRRKRIFLVADFGGLTAPEILFKQDSLPGDSAQGRGQGEGAAGAVKGGALDPGRDCLMPGDARMPGTEGNTGTPQTLCLNDQEGKREDTGLFENHGIDARYTGPLPVAPALAAHYGTGGNNVPLIMQETACYCITGNAVGRRPENGGNGFGCQEDLAYTLTSTDRHTVFSCQRSDLYKENTIAATQCASQAKGGTDLVIEPTKFIRRLTPLECERLQGFPDGWTDIPGASDSARYKALGNSVAIPCVDFVFHGIAYFLRESGKG